MLPKGHLAMSKDIFGCHGAGGGGAVSSGWRPGILLNILQHTGHTARDTELARPKYQ